MKFNYTAELREFFEPNTEEDYRNALSHKEKIEKGRSKLFDFEYPIFDESYRSVFETNFIRKFYLREIGFETFGLFKFQLETWFAINMPYYNKLFESELIEYDPLTNSKTTGGYTKTNNNTKSDVRDINDVREVTGETNSESNRIGLTDNTQHSTMSGNSENTQTKSETGSAVDDNFDRKLESTTPDGRLNLTANDGEGVIEYASNIKENTENNSKNTTVNGTNNSSEVSKLNSANTGKTSIDDNLKDLTQSTVTQNENKNDVLTSTATNIEEFINNKVGKIGVQSFPKMVKDYRESLLRVEKQIFDEMQELFMLLY